MDAFSQPDAPSLIRGGVRSDVASSFLLPDGVFPRMRLLAWGVVERPHRFKSPSDKAWWAKRYQYPLWAPIETYLDQVTRAGHEPPAWMWDAELAAGDAAELSRSLAGVVQGDLPPVNEAPCPKWLIPPTRGMLPIANPACIEKPPRDEVDKVHPPARRTDYSWLMWVAIGYLVLEDRR